MIGFEVEAAPYGAVQGDTGTCDRSNTQRYTFIHEKTTVLLERIMRRPQRRRLVGGSVVEMEMLRTVTVT